MYDDATTRGTHATTTTPDAVVVDNNNKMTVKAAVQSCWPDETPLEIVRLIRRGCIDVWLPSFTTNDAAQPPPLHAEPSEDSEGWTTVRQHGKRILRPNQYLRRRRIRDITTDDSNNEYDVRMVPSYPMVVAMNKPRGYIVTHPSRRSTTTIHSDEDGDDATETLPGSSSSMSVYDLLFQSTAAANGTTTTPLPPSPQSSSSSAAFLSHLRAVGRLDKDTEGLLLFTNHGRWNIALTNPIKIIDDTTNTTNASPHHHDPTVPPVMRIWKRYRCVLQKPATAQDLQDWIRGGIPFRHLQSPQGIAFSLPARSAQFVTGCPAALRHFLHADVATNHDHTTRRRPNEDDHGRIVDVTIGEGKYRQIRRCWESLSHNKVIYLQRLSFGPIELVERPDHHHHHHHVGHENDPVSPHEPAAAATTTLPPGQWRFLSPAELRLLEHYVHLWYRHNPNYQS